MPFPVLDLRKEARAHMPKVPLVRHLAASAQQTWARRMVNEYRSSSVFVSLAEELEEAGMDPESVAQCRVFSEEEKRHGILCGAVVEALGAEGCEEMPPEPPFPMHRDVPPREGLVRNLLSVGCLSETVAVALIGAERLEMPPGELRDLLTGIYADEIGHARFGWAHVARLLPAMDAHAKKRLSIYLAVALAHLEDHELRHLPLDSTPPPEGAALGLCSGADARVLFYEVVSEVILPRLEALGLEARKAWRLRHA
jgi:hypothetical protein